MSGNVGNDIDYLIRHGHKMGVAVRIAPFPFKSYFLFRFPLPVSWPTFEVSDVGRCWVMSPTPDPTYGSVICRSGVVENVRVAVGVALLSLCGHELLLCPVSTCQFVGSKPPYWHFR